MTALHVALRGPTGEDVDLWRTLNSHGFAELSPMRLDEATRSLETTVPVDRGAPRRVRISAGTRGRARVDILGGPPPSAGTQEAVGRMIAWILHLDQDLSGLYAQAAADPELAWVTAGAGRMLRSPTAFEDVIKTLCTTNCSWGLTVAMVNALVRELGRPAAGHRGDQLMNAFPTPQSMAEPDEAFYRSVVRSGYRAPSLLRLARSVADGELDLESLAASSREDVPDEDVERQLLALPGIGPYAAAHVMMTFGRASSLILDSWTRPKYARMAGRKTIPADTTIRRRFRRFAPDAGLAFWLFVTQDWVEPEGLPRQG